jgi:dihydroorotate dehydrogenase electron transfer subunit
LNCKIIRNESLGGHYHIMSFEWKGNDATPGQFVMLRVFNSTDPLLRRPMSIAGLNNGIMNIIYSVSGRGSAILERMNGGDMLDVIGPFGNGFTLPDDAQAILCIMGGVGTAPFIFLKNRNNGRNFIAFYGAANSDGLGIKAPFSEIHFATIDGSVGKKGLVTDILLEHPAIKNKSNLILACGPTGMLKAVDEICAKYGISGQLSLEEKMGCGFGVCLGCVVDSTEGKKRICVEGPIFKAGTVKWRN